MRREAVGRAAAGRAVVEHRADQTLEPPPCGISRKLPGWIAAAPSGLSGLGILALVLLVVVDVARRAAGHDGIAGAVDISAVALVVVVFLAMAGAERNGRNVRTPLITNQLPARAGHAFRCVANVGACAFVAWMTFETAQTAHQSFLIREYSYGLAQVPIWPAKIAVPVGLALLAVMLIVRAIGSATKVVIGAEAEIEDADDASR